MLGTQQKLTEYLLIDCLNKLRTKMYINPKLFFKSMCL